ncbi:iron chelate uptake ABC transporter family permease subunit [Vibrio sp. ZSDE26]|uniref:Iron chelate uptake ABC transporter family permease subunit n=1 Tax=Vibrio amylolyticus TaxID=2847292 RepID=A0A9X1XGR8_9VIBR|nr:iron chelate uptake ABC transporter family permease subunit [Vibrio amylolyticus]MCK6261675.1 iron chelate uptake ABC transporter family permease subunit [Vibrio amylolyticus]
MPHGNEDNYKLVSAAISRVGVMSFIGLLSPNIARAIDAITPKSELMISTILGAVLLITVDWITMFIGSHTLDIVPSGTAVALIGVSALIFFTRRKLKAKDQFSITLPRAKAILNRFQYVKLMVLFIIIILVAVFVTRNNVDGALEWTIRWPDEFALSLL